MQHNLTTHHENFCQQVSILPSYQMYQNVMDRSINLRTEIYEPLPPYITGDSYSDAESFSSFSTSSSASDSTSISIVHDDDSYGPKILDTHRKLISHVNENIEMSIKFTTSNELGKEPDFINVEKKEYHQGDTISGFVNIKNTSTKLISFDFFYVIFEGNLMQCALIVNRAYRSENFLQIIDLAASSHFANIHDVPDFDLFDSTKLHFEEGGYLLPQVTYKRFFSFKIPEKLLDHGISRVSLHQELPPSTTISKENMFEKFIQYSVDVKVIGLNNALSKYQTMQEVEKIIRVIPLKTFSLEQEEKFHEAEVKYNFNTLVNVMKNYLKSNGSEKKLIGNNDTGSLDYTFNKTTEHTKFLLHPTKKQLIGNSKSLGCVVATIPKLHFKVQYIAPQLFRPCNIDASALDTWNIKFPLQLEYSQTRKCSLPKIKSMSANLVQIQISSATTIPIEINHEMLFNNFTGHDFETLVQKKFMALVKEVKNKASSGVNDWTATDPFIREAEKLTNLKTRRLLLNVPILNSQPEIEWEKNMLGNLTSVVNLSLDLSKAISPKCMEHKEEGYAFDVFNLTPCFQNSSVIRMYYIEFDIVFSQSMSLLFKLPITIEN